MTYSESGLLSLVHTYGMVVLFLVVLAQELGIPLLLPSDLLLLTAGSLVEQGQFNLGITVVTVVLATMLGTGVLFTLARHGGRPLLRRYGRWIHLDDARLQQAEHRVRDHAFWRLTALRLVPGLRPYSTVMAGLLAIPRLQAILAFLLAAVIWAVTWIAIGDAMGPHLGRLIHWLPRVEQTLRAGIIVVVGVTILVLVLRARLVHARHMGKRPDRSK